MKRQSKQYKHTAKLLKFFLFAQLSALAIAATIVTIILIPNNFKQRHQQYKKCLDQHTSLNGDELGAVCPKPYSK